MSATVPSLPVIGNRSTDARADVLFDETHGQANWSQTGFSSRQIMTNLAGVAELFRRLGLHCASTRVKPLEVHFPPTRVLVIPPPTGTYDAQHERWQKQATALFTPDEVCTVLRFLRNGGRLVAFAYRFGDSFTQTNLGQLALALGCLLNDDAIVDLSQMTSLYPLESFFVTSERCLPLPWTAAGITALRWRCMATFTILPGSSAFPLVYSPGGRCLSYNRTYREISFQSLPIAVAGRYGAGKFVLFGGPHAFETSPLGLLDAADNAHLLQNIVEWLLAEPLPDSNLIVHSQDLSQDLETRLRVDWQWRTLCRLHAQGSGKPSVEAVEQLLRQTETFHALPRKKWGGGRF